MSEPTSSTRAFQPRIRDQTRTRVRLAIRGLVQGVGFRPYVYRIAHELGLDGWIQNTPAGVFVEAEGSRQTLDRFLEELRSSKPPRAFVQSLETTWLDPAGHSGFQIRESAIGGAPTALVLPDIATCPECLREIFDPSNRRYEYPFTNCTNCGPRFSIIEALPYDRAHTSMKRFEMCPECRAEYEDPANRRFHAQPNACPACGPHLELWDPAGNTLAVHAGALAAAADALRSGSILAVKSIGGFHLMVAAHHEEGVRRLRTLKHREEKPFALLFPSIDSVRRECLATAVEERLLSSPEAPIVLLRRRTEMREGPALVASGVAPGNPNLGVMLPSNPLHHLLMAQLGWPVVATSGNISDEPICVDEREAIERLKGIADLFLVHNRPIVRHIDDSITRVLLDRELVLRRARGYAPLPISIKTSDSMGSGSPILAVGAHLKNSIALAHGGLVFISQHIGDLETEPSDTAFRRVIRDFEILYRCRPETIAADMHPDYQSSEFASRHAAQLGARLVFVQHHVAHVLSCMAENEVEPPALGVAWDGTGLGTDGLAWGGEFFHVTKDRCERVARLRSFPLPGGDKAVKEPRRTAVGLLYEMRGSGLFDLRDLAPLQSLTETESQGLKIMLERGVNCPRSTSVGRLFDGIASLSGLRQLTRFEGQSAMELEFSINKTGRNGAYEFQLTPAGDAEIVEGSGAAPGRTAAVELDWAPVIREVINDVRRGVPAGIIASRFHLALANSIVAVARHAGLERVVLSGGCFQNGYLTQCGVELLRAEGFRPFWHQRVPPNDGGIALGQVVAALRSTNAAKG